jgi:hypothetical protein
MPAMRQAGAGYLLGANQDGCVSAPRHRLGGKWPEPLKTGAGEGIRTLDPNPGKVGGPIAHVSRRVVRHKGLPVPATKFSPQFKRVAGFLIPAIITVSAPCQGSSSWLDARARPAGLHGVPSRPGGRRIGFH